MRRFEAVESLSERYLYEGDFVFTGEHSGTNIKYGGNRLRAYITPIGESENVDYSNLHVEFLIRPQTSVHHIMIHLKLLLLLLMVLFMILQK